MESLKLARSIVAERIRPAIERLPPDSITRFKAISVASPALFLAAHPTGKEIIDQLPERWKDSALCEVIDFICKKQPYWEPLDLDNDHVYELTEDEIAQICALLPEIQMDAPLYTTISIICTTLISKYGRRTFTEQQRVHFASKLTEIVKGCLPRARFIQHDGYKIICLAQLQRLGRRNQGAWNCLVEDARKLPNSADRSLILAILARIGGSEDYSGSRELLDEAKAIADCIPSRLDRIGRYHFIAEEARHIDKEFTKTLLRDAMVASMGGDEPEVEEQRKNIIDSAYRISPELASDIASALDDDQARVAKRPLMPEWRCWN